MKKIEFLVCDKCGVAYDVGEKTCNNKWCFNTNYEYVKPVKKVKSKKAYKPRPKPHGWTRWSSIVSRSKKKSLECDLTLEDVKLIIDMSCVYCNSTEKIEVDRKDSTRGYTKDNVAPACHRCNTIKNNVVTYDEMMFIASYLGWRK